MPLDRGEASGCDRALKSDGEASGCDRALKSDPVVVA
jgi:hypothetical protein